MNERIRQLAERLDPVATIGNWGRVEWADNVYPQLDDKMYAAIDLQKFAELIVRECGNWFNSRLVVEPDYGMEHRIERNRAVVGVMKEFNQHFGVEQ